MAYGEILDSKLRISVCEEGLFAATSAASVYSLLFISTARDLFGPGFDMSNIPAIPEGDTKRFRTELFKRLRIAFDFIGRRYAVDISTRWRGQGAIERCRPEEIAYLVSVSEVPSTCLGAEFRTKTIVLEKIQNWTADTFLHGIKSIKLVGRATAWVVEIVLKKNPGAASLMASEPSRDGLIDYFILHEIGHLYGKPSNTISVARSATLEDEILADEFALSSYSGGITDRIAPAVSLFLLWGVLLDLDLVPTTARSSFAIRLRSLQENICRIGARTRFRPPDEIAEIPAVKDLSGAMDSVFSEGCKLDR